MIVSLKKINIIFLKTFKSKIIKLLQSFGQAEIVQTMVQPKIKKNLEEKIERINLQVSNLEFCLQFLKNYQNKEKKSFLSSFSKIKPKLTPQKTQEIYKKTQTSQVIAQCKKAEEDLNNIQNQLNSLKEEKIKLLPWKKMQTMPTETFFTKTLSGKINLIYYSAFFQTLEKEIQLSALEKIAQNSKIVFFNLIFTKDQAEKIQTILKKYKIDLTEWNLENQAPKFRLQEIKQKTQSFKSQFRKIQKNLRNLSQKIENLEISYDFLIWKKEKLEAQRKLLSTRYFSIISLWTYEKILPHLKKALQKIDPAIMLEKAEIGPNENPPVIIRNNTLIEPFESVTNIYGLPRAQELDPTPFLAPFFILFFALCLTDAGYGIVMAILSLLIIKFLKIPKENQKLFKLLFYGGIVTIFIGALFGGWFGIDLDALKASPLKNFLIRIRLINPMKDTLLFMGLTFALGFLQIWFSQVVKLYHSIKTKNKDMIKQSILWIIFLGSLLFFGLSKTVFKSLAGISFYIFLASFISLLMLEKKEIKFFLRPFLGLISILQTLIGFMSDILSYSRLMALGLATGIIGFIINIIAGIFRDMIPYAGYVVWILILVGGHLFNIGINALGGFIHSGRLQFVEFFPKFLEGGGRIFKPFGYRCKYISLKNTDK